mgnify:FL=1
MKKIYIASTLGLFLLSCNNPQPASQQEEAAPAPITETVAQADSAQQTDAVSSATNVAKSASYNGVITVPPQRQATVTLTIGGSIHSTNLLPGSYVRQGEVIATLENPEFIQLQQTYLESAAQAEYLEKEYNRQKMLSEQEAASQKRFQQSKADYLSMKSRMDAAAAQLKLLQVDVRQLHDQGIEPYLQVKSPLDGYVTNMKVNLGTYLNAGEPICDIINKGETLLELTAYEKDLDYLQVGSSVEFQVNGMGSQTFEATVITIGQEVDDVNRSLQVYARVKDQNSRFRPGMYVSAKIRKND